VPLRDGRACRTALLLCGVVSAIAPAAALASTYTVDDDKLDCPNASFTSIQAAVNQAAPHDTIKVCAGVYDESSTPVGTTGTNMANPLQPGARNGLTINEALNIVGAGADKVIIEPAPVAGSRTLAAVVGGVETPNLRDGGGNVITIGRQSLGSTDFTENPVNISGVTIQSPSIYAEAGVAFFNASGSITNSVIGPLATGAGTGSTLAARPYGYGVIATNSLQGAGLGTARRQVTLSSDLITGYQSGGVFFDDSFGYDGATTLTQRSGIIQYGSVDHTRVVGAGLTSAFPQTGITYRAGQRGSVTNSEVTGNLYKTDPTKSVGIQLTDAETGADPNNPSKAGFSATGDTLAGNGVGLFNADITGTAVRTGAPAQAGSNFWGCATGPIVGASDLVAGCQGVSGNDSGTTPAASVAFAPFLTAGPAALSVPTGTSDAAPTAAIRDPLAGASVAPGVEIDPVVVAKDDYGVKSVSLTANGAPVATVLHTPYEFSYTPTADQVGSSIVFVATATDSVGQSTSTSLTVNVPGATTPAAGGGGSAPSTTPDTGASTSAPSAETPTPAPTTPTTPTTPAAAPTTSPSAPTVAAKIVYPKSVKGTKKLKLVTVTCADPTATHCTVSITGTLKVGRKTYTVKLKGTVTGSDPKTFVLTLSKKGTALIKGKQGTLKLTTTVKSSSGATAKASKTLTAKGA
jgi:hypothetical protein